MAKNMKITELSKDFAMKSKDVCDAFREIGVDKNSGGSVSDGEFESFMQHMTSTHQIGDIDAYMDGKVSIRSVRPKKEEKPAAKAEPKRMVMTRESSVDTRPTYMVLRNSLPRLAVVNAST